MSENSDKPFLKASNISFQYGVVPVVEDVNFTVERGEVLGISGPSGSGKTTILRLVAGLEKPDSGSIVMGGKSVSGEKIMAPPYQRGCSMVFQGFFLWPHMTVTKHLQFVLPKREVKENQQRIADILNFVDLIGEKNCYPYELSGGEQQRLAIARAVIASPDYLLLDEPFSNLDLKRRKEMLSLLTILPSEEQTTILYVSHDIQELLKVADMILFLEENQQTFFGTKEEFVRRWNLGAEMNI